VKADDAEIAATAEAILWVLGTKPAIPQIREFVIEDRGGNQPPPRRLAPEMTML